MIYRVSGVLYLSNPSKFQNIFVFVSGNGMPAGLLPQTMNQIDLIVVKRNKLLTPTQTALFIIFPTNYKNLPFQHANPEILALSLHRFHSSKTLISLFDMIIFNYNFRWFVSLPKDIVTIIIWIKDRLRNAYPFILPIFRQPHFAMRDTIHSCNWFSEELLVLLLGIFFEIVQVTLSLLIIKDMILMSLIFILILFIKGKYPLQILLKISNQTKNTIILYCSFK